MRELLFLAGILASTAFAGETMQVDSDESRIFLKRNGKVILQYNKVPTEEAANHEAHFTREGYIHPVYSPGGIEVTGDYSPDHKHQHGLFFAWTKTRVGDQPAEFWNQKLKMGSIRFEAASGIFEGAKSCGFVVEHLWDAKSGDGTLSPAIHETWKVTAHDAGDEVFLFDIETEQRQRSEAPVTIQKYHYGGMAIRGNGAWLPEGEGMEPVGTIRTDAGLLRIEGNHSRPRWVTMEGPVGGKLAGVTVMGHPSNFRSPQWVRLHPRMPYFVWAPMVEEPFRIAGGKPYRSRFRYVVHDGAISEAALEDLYRDWVEPE